MRNGLALAVVLAVALCFALPQVTLADFYDNFNDGHYWQNPNDEPFNASIGVWPYFNTPTFDPNAYDIDNTHWAIVALMGDAYLADASDGWLRLYAQMGWLPNYFIGATAVDASEDPNTSTTFFDDRASHYILARMKAYDTTKGELMLFVHANPTDWTGYSCTVELGDRGDPTKKALFMSYWFEALTWQRCKGSQYRPWLNFGTGFWMLCQFESDGDPNHSHLRISAWNGGKYDRDPNMDRYIHIFTDWDPNKYAYWGEGRSGFATLSSEMNGSPLDLDAKFDEIECRWGTFTNVSRNLQLYVVKPNYGSVNVDPMLSDPNDPNLPDQRLLRYTDGTAIVLTATPISGKAFDSWAIWEDPNRYPDSNYVVTDANATLFLTMDKHYLVEATFKCGSGLEPFAAVGLLALMLGAFVRRLLN